MRIVAGALCLAIVGCRTPAGEPEVLVVVPPDVPAGESFAVAAVLEARDLSVATATVRGTLPAHIHRRHAETVYVLSGTARMRLGDKWHELVPGQLVHVPPGTVHAVVSREGASVLSIFTPPFDGEDREFVR